MTGLLDFLEEHQRAVEYDLIGLGLRLRHFPSADLSWGDMLAVVQHAPPTSAVYRSVNPHWQRTLEVDLLRSVEYDLRVLAWQQGSGKKNNYPDPIRLPWDDAPRKAWQSDPLDFDEDFGDDRMRAALDRVMAQLN